MRGFSVRILCQSRRLAGPFLGQFNVAAQSGQRRLKVNPTARSVSVLGLAFCAQSFVPFFPRVEQTVERKTIMPTDLEIAFIDYLNAVALFLERSLDQASSQDDIPEITGAQESAACLSSVIAR